MTSTQLNDTADNQDYDWIAKVNSINAASKGTRSRANSISNTSLPITPGWIASPANSTTKRTPPILEQPLSESKSSLLVNNTSTTSATEALKTPIITTLRTSPTFPEKVSRSEIIQDPTLGPTLRKVKSTPSQALPRSSSSGLGRKASWLLSKFSHKSRNETPSPPPPQPAPSSMSGNRLKRTSSISIATLNELDHNYTMQTSSISALDVNKLNPKTDVSTSNINNANSKKTSRSINSQVPANLIQTPVPQAKLSPEMASGSLSPISSLEETSTTLNSNTTATEPPKSGFLMNTLRKLKATTDHSMPISSQCPRKVLNVNKSKTVCPVSALQKLNVRRVKFSIDTFMNDPPQQIPARVPKEGTVKVGDDGSIVRPHHAADLSNPTKNYHTTAYAASVAAYNAATIVANVVRSENKRALSKLSKHADTSCKEEEEEDVPATLNTDKLKIDTPMHEGGGSTNNSRSNSITSVTLGDSAESTTNNHSNNSTGNKKKAEISLSELYTRCCHLREIMPIKATLTQLEGSTGTLSHLRLMNPRPTMIEVLAFSDFLSVTKITTVVLNNLDITEDMFRNLILSLAFSKTLFKLSLKNTNITPASWKVLCAFLVTNKRLMKLDISVAEPRDGKKQIRYKQDKFYDRMNLDWNLLTKTLVARGGIEELIINGCMVPHEQFHDLISKGCSIATKRLGVASSDLQESDLLVLSEWTIQTNCVCEGIDLGGNDISNLTELVAKIFSQKSLLFVSLNSCHLVDAAEIGSIFQAHRNDSKLRFLDISFNPDIFPAIVPTLATYLPDYSKLKRIQLDYNGLRSKDIIRLADTFAKCTSLSHISLLGNREINAAAGEALAVAVKFSPTITFVDIDSDLIPENIMRRLSHYCMQNAERLVKQKIDSSDADNEYNFESELELLDDGTELVNAVKYVVDNNEDAKSPTSESAASNVSSEKKGLCDSESSSKLFSEGLAKRADVVRTKVRQRIESIMQNYEHYTEVEPEIREKLIKLYYLDATLETALSKYNMLKRKIYPSSFGVYYPSSPKDEARKTDKSLGSSDVEKPASESTESVESSAETAAAEGTVLRTLSPPAVQDYVEPAAASPSASEQYKQREREEGDFHKLGVFIRHTKSSQSLTHPLDASGSQLRQLLLDESGVTRSEDIESFINRLRGMSDAELQAYFRCIYGKKLAAPDYDDSDDNSDSSESFGEAHKLGQVIAPDAMVVKTNVPAVTITEN